MVNYIKGQQAALVVKSVKNKLDDKGQHKAFKRQDGSIRYVFEIEFVDGYTAEYAFPGPIQPDFIPGKVTEFKVIQVNEYGHTIAPVAPVTRPATVIGTTGMSGHPAVFAFGFAKDLSILKKDWTLNDVKVAADDILDWLLENKNKTER